METFAITELAYPFITIFMATFVISFIAIKSIALSFSCAIVKSGIFLIYFGLIFDGSYILLDDVTYIKGGIILASQGISFLNFFTHWDAVKSVAGGSDTVFYYLYNALAFQFFNTQNYYAPVAFNIILTALVSFIGYRLAKKELELSELSAKLFFLFLIFHPDVLIWSSLINIKDITVLFMHLALLVAIANAFNRRWPSALLITTATLPFILLNRYYILGLFGISLLIFFMSSKQESRYRIIFFILILFFTIFLFKGFNAFTYPVELIAETFVNPLYGLGRFILTPIPFNTEPIYAFLDLPALIHWLLTPFFLLGIYQVWKQGSRFGRFVVLYLFVFLGIYAMVGELQGPRHRVQLDFAFALFQFMGLLTTYQWVRARFNPQTSIQIS